MNEYLSTRLGLWSEYHNHKETMANAGFLVQMSLFGAIVTESIWPPEWVAHVTDLPRLITFLVYLVLWFLIHYYTRWQLINKRVAALFVAGFEKAYQQYLNDPNTVDRSLCTDEGARMSRLKSVLSGLIFVPGGFMKMDASVQGMPMFIAAEVQKKFKTGTGAETLEILITYASIGLMMIVGVKVFFG